MHRRLTDLRARSVRAAETEANRGTGTGHGAEIDRAIESPAKEFGNVYTTGRMRMDGRARATSGGRRRTEKEGPRRREQRITAL